MHDWLLDAHTTEGLERHLNLNEMPHINDKRTSLLGITEALRYAGKR